MVQLKTQNNPPEEYKEAKYGVNVVQQDKGINSQKWIGLQNLAYVQYICPTAIILVGYDYQPLVCCVQTIEMIFFSSFPIGGDPKS